MSKEVIPPSISSEEAIATLEADKKRRIDRCNQGINELLKAQNCTLSVSILITSKGNVPQIVIFPL